MVGGSNPPGRAIFMSSKFSKSFLSLAFFLAIFFVITIGFTESEPVQLYAKDFPKDWSQTNLYEATSEQLVKFGKTLGVPILKLTNVNFEVKDKNQKIQINTISCQDAKDAEVVYNSLVDMVGTSNWILVKDNGVIEIITNHPELTTWLIDRIKPNQINSPKKNPET